MATRIDNDVTLSHQDAQSVAKMLDDYATQQAAHAQRTRSEAVRAQCHADVRLARWIGARITERLYTWESAPVATCGEADVTLTPCNPLPDVA